MSDGGLRTLEQTLRGCLPHLGLDGRRRWLSTLPSGFGAGAWSGVSAANTARRVWRDLLAEGVECGLHRIERLMRLQALRARPRRRRLPKDEGDRPVVNGPLNLQDWQFEAERPNQKWIADFTCVWTAEGWLYVSASIDLYSRRVVGWSMSASMTAQLVADAPSDGCLAAQQVGRLDASLRSWQPIRQRTVPALDG
jgi:transposase InsO family protein